MEKRIKQKFILLDALIKKMEKKEKISLVKILRDELVKLKELNKEYKKMINEKKVVHEEQNKGKIRYHLNDGSTYVVSRDKKYRYLYDANSRIITYEFDNGQVERTFPNGLKEIRYSDGSIGIRNGSKDYDYIK